MPATSARGLVRSESSTNTGLGERRRRRGLGLWTGKPGSREHGKQRRQNGLFFERERNVGMGLSASSTGPVLGPEKQKNLQQSSCLGP